MERITWNAAQVGLDSALVLCKNLGLDESVDRSRFITYQRVVTNLASALTEGGAEAARAQFDEDRALSLIALTEAAEFADVADFARQYGAGRLRPTLRRVLHGPVLPNEEDENSNEGRNRLFELVVASKLWKAGLRPRVGDRPDLTCEVPGQLFYVECKRPMSKRGAQQSIGRARDMLAAEIGAEPRAALGIIAMSLTKLLNPGDQLLVYRGEERGKEHLSRALEVAAESVRESWERLPSEIVGLFWHAIMPGLDEGIPLYVVAQFMNVHSVAPPHSLNDHWFRMVYAELAKIWGHPETSPHHEGLGK